jgi:hypothetical protein
MKIHKVYIALGLLIAFVLFFEFAAHADEIDDSTKITFCTQLQIPGQVLPAGAHTFQEADANSESGLVDHSVVYAPLQAVSAERREPTGDTKLAR